MELFGCHSMCSSRNIITLACLSTSHTNTTSSSYMQVKGNTDLRSITLSSNIATSLLRLTHIVTILEESAIQTIMSFFISKTQRTNLLTSKSMNGSLMKVLEQWEGGPKSFQLVSTHSPLSTRVTRPKLLTFRCTSTQLLRYQRSTICEYVVDRMLNVITTLFNKRF